VLRVPLGLGLLGRRRGCGERRSEAHEAQRLRFRRHDPHCYTKRHSIPDPSLFALDSIAERRILQAIARGDFDDLPGAGRPLALDDDPLVPAETRIAHRILKNAGYVPLEMLERAEIARLEAALPELD